MIRPLRCTGPVRVVVGTDGPAVDPARGAPALAAVGEAAAAAASRVVEEAAEGPCLSELEEL
ncbi:hypothetical protein ACWEKC_02980, partial [Streptomyces misionensis]